MLLCMFCGKWICVLSWGNLLMWVFYLQIYDRCLSWPFMSEEWGGETNDKIGCACFGLPFMGVWVCVCVSVCLSVGTMALLRCWESQAPSCLACWIGVSRGTFGWIRWLLCPFQVWLLCSGTRNMNLEAIKDGWIAGCLLTILFHCSDTGSTQNPTDLWVLRIHCETDFNFTAVNNLIRLGNFL